MHVMLGEIRLAIFIDVHMISYVVCSSERTLSTKMTATLFSEPAQQNAQHSCAFAKNFLWQIMPSLLNSEGAGHGLPDGLVEVWDCGTTRYREWHLLIWADPRLPRPQRLPPHVRCRGQKQWNLQSGEICATTEATGMTDWESEFMVKFLGLCLLGYIYCVSIAHR